MPRCRAIHFFREHLLLWVILGRQVRYYFVDSKIRLSAAAVIG
jgi:hypothetical protein